MDKDTVESILTGLESRSSGVWLTAMFKAGLTFEEQQKRIVSEFAQYLRRPISDEYENYMDVLLEELKTELIVLNDMKEGKENGFCIFASVNPKTMLTRALYVIPPETANFTYCFFWIGAKPVTKIVRNYLDSSVDSILGYLHDTNKPVEEIEAKNYFGSLTK